MVLLVVLLVVLLAMLVVDKRTTSERQARSTSERIRSCSLPLLLPQRACMPAGMMHACITHTARLQAQAQARTHDAPISSFTRCACNASCHSLPMLTACASFATWRSM
jgi:hypothetical protein